MLTLHRVCRRFSTLYVISVKTEMTLLVVEISLVLYALSCGHGAGFMAYCLAASETGLCAKI